MRRRSVWKGMGFYTLNVHYDEVKSVMLRIYGIPFDVSVLPNYKSSLLKTAEISV
jgi:hypothetical protein